MVKTKTIWVERFGKVERVTHALLIVSFLGLAATGLPLLFSHTAWARTLAHALGGFQMAGWVHRMCAVVLIGIFAVHVGRILRRLIVDKEYGILWGPDSMVPQPRDVAQIVQHFRFFMGFGPRPRFDHFTYWEKFDYWAVFWGMFIIGGSGLMLWFPTFFSLFLPGWLLNIALLIHGEEALLATGFIFTIHFFNENFRPARFPMNTVMFSGRETLEEIEHTRPAEYERLRAAGSLESLDSGPPTVFALRWGRSFGAVALTIGVGLLILILLAVFS